MHHYACPSLAELWRKQRTLNCERADSSASGSNKVRARNDSCQRNSMQARAIKSREGDGTPKYTFYLVLVEFYVAVHLPIVNGLTWISLPISHKVIRNSQTLLELMGMTFAHPALGELQHKLAQLF